MTAALRPDNVLTLTMITFMYNSIMPPSKLSISEHEHSLIST